MTDYIQWTKKKVTKQEFLEKISKQQGGRGLNNALAQRIQETREKMSLNEAISPHQAGRSVINKDNYDTQFPSPLAARGAEK